MTGWSLIHVGVTGREWELFGRHADGGVNVTKDGLPTFSANRRAVTQAFVGGAGRSLVRGRSTSHESQGTLTVQITSNREDTADGYWADFIADWSIIDYCIWRLTSPDGQRFVSRVRLDDGKGIPSPAELGSPRHEVSLPIVRDRSTWGRELSKPAGDVVIVNTGADKVYPRFSWKDGGTVTHPSGWSLTLPPQPDRVYMSLSPDDSHMVTTAGGEELHDVWRALYYYVRAEAVPAGESYTFVTTGDVTTHWEVGVDNPWKI